jgi:hypothetical protein
MKSRIHFLLLFTFFISAVAHAQFEGKILMNLYGTDDQGNRTVNNIQLFATADRILIQGAESVNLNPALNAKGLLIRNDSRDFVVMMDGNKALQFTKADLEATFRMFARMGEQNGGVESTSDVDGVSYTYTNKVRTINGFEATELRMEKEDEKGYLSIWLSPDIKLNWGMLKEPWLDVPKNMRTTADRLTQEFKSSNFPVLIEAHDSENTTTQAIFEVAEVERNSIAKAMVQVPSGMTLMGLNEFMFMLMMGN